MTKIFKKQKFFFFQAKDKKISINSVIEQKNNEIKNLNSPIQKPEENKNSIEAEEKKANVEYEKIDFKISTNATKNSKINLIGTINIILPKVVKSYIN